MKKILMILLMVGLFSTANAETRIFEVWVCDPSDFQIFSHSSVTPIYMTNKTIKSFDEMSGDQTFTILNPEVLTIDCQAVNYYEDEILYLQVFTPERKGK